MTTHWEHLIEAQIEKLQRGETNNTPESTTKLPKHMPLNAAQFEALVEQKIQQAMADGLFDNLQGAGKPLDLYDDLYVPDDMKMAFRLMKGQGIAPVWIELQKDYRTGNEQYRAWHASVRTRWQAMKEADRLKNLAELRRRISNLNTIIHNLNAAVPSDSLRVGLLIYERELAHWEGAGR